MKNMRCIHRWAVAILGMGLAAGMAPLSRAQAPASAASTTSTASGDSQTSAADTQKRLDDLQKELTELQSQIAALKAAQDAAPSVKTAALTSPSPSASAMTPAPAAADAPEKVSIASLLGPTTITGLVDAYYQFNSNHPFDNTSGFRFFDGNTNSFSLNMAEVGIAKAPDSSSTEGRFGYHIVAGYGDAAFVVNSSDLATDGANFYLEQAYGSYLAPIGKGLQIDVGKFVTPIGNEVIESSGDWNYSRGLLFYYAIPYYHVGARATYTFNPKWTVAGYLVNGWNNTIIVHNLAPFTGQSAGLNYIGSVTFTPNAKWSVIENYVAGPQVDAYNFTDTKAITDWKQLSDTVISYTPNGKWAFALNGDYGTGPRSYVVGPGGIVSQSPAADWGGIAAYAKYTLGPKSYAAIRYEYYLDPYGYTGLLNGANGHAQEITGTYAYNFTSGLQVRAEYRYDFASLPIFTYGGTPFDKKSQNTAELGFIYTFSSANAK
jgi:Putative beta-barrel porin-2, OmpL-like. bbp2